MHIMYVRYGDLYANVTHYGQSVTTKKHATTRHKYAWYASSHAADTSQDREFKAWQNFCLNTQR